MDSEAAPDVVVVMPAYNAEHTIEEAIGGILSQKTSRKWELVVADNGSSDASAFLASQLLDSVPNGAVVDASARRGPAAARNIGAKASNAPLLLFCDSDDIADARWIEEMWTAAQNSGIVGGLLEERSLNPGHSENEQLHKGGLVRPLSFLPVAASANMAVWRTVFDEVGGFDEAYGVPGPEDADLSWRVQLAGHRLSFAEGAVVAYRHRSGLFAVARRAFNYNVQGALLYKRFRAYGATWRGWRRALMSWTAVIALVPAATLSAQRRRRLAWVAGSLAGKLVGTLRYRILYL